MFKGFIRAKMEHVYKIFLVNSHFMMPLTKIHQIQTVSAIKQAFLNTFCIGQSHLAQKLIFKAK